VHWTQGSITANISFPRADQGILSFTKIFGSLYSGHLRQDVFKKRYQQIVHQTLESLRNINLLLHDQEQIVALGNRLDMIRRAQHESWRWPIQVNSISSTEFSWGNGQSRILATGLCKKEPWQQLKAIVLAPASGVASYILQDPCEIISDDDLEQYLECQTETVSFNAAVVPGWFGARLEIHNIKNSIPFVTLVPAAARVSNFQQWHQIYGPVPSLKIVNGDLHSQKGCWQVSENAQHRLELLKPCNIDIDELWFWMDTDHDVYQDLYGRFCLYRGHGTRVTTISIG
jgi:hypothetical protein